MQDDQVRVAYIPLEKRGSKTLNPDFKYSKLDIKNFETRTTEQRVYIKPEK
jgi:hypothetical protein